MTSAANDLLAAVQLARTEAAKRQQAVSICALQNPPGADPLCSGAALSALGAQGWLVFVDPNRDCTRVAPADQIIAYTTRVGADDGITSAAAGNCISFGPNGFLVQPVAILLCDRRGLRTDSGSGLTHARGFALSPSGSARITRDFAQIRDTLGLACP